MARFFDLSSGKLMQFLRQLSEADFTAEMAEDLIKKPEIVHEVVARARLQLCPPEVPSLERQLDLWHYINGERDWGIEKQEFQAAARDIRRGPSRRLERGKVELICVYLEGQDGLSGVQRTYRELMRVISEQYSKFVPWPGIIDAEVRLLDGLGHRPGVERVVLDVEAFWHPDRSYCLDDARKQADALGWYLAHAECLAFIAMNVDYVKAQDGWLLPAIQIPGYRLKVTEDGEVLNQDTLGFGWDDQIQPPELQANVHRSDQRETEYAAPLVWKATH